MSTVRDTTAARLTVGDQIKIAGLAFAVESVVVDPDRLVYLKLTSSPPGARDTWWPRSGGEEADLVLYAETEVEVIQP